jgi:imidazole glycerol-phosphate synthase subunit HisH
LALTCGGSVIAIINYDMANLRSVQKAFEQVGHSAIITSDPAEVAAAERIVLPGVGACDDALSAVRARRLDEPIRAAIAANKPFLGICLGLQMLFERSYENGIHEGLGILPGEVVKFQLPAGFKVPHMGWNQVRQRGDSPLMAGIESGAHFYFVHSYYVVPREESLIATTADYGGEFCASIARGNLFATQFHPEKSQANGLRLLKNFAELPV